MTEDEQNAAAETRRLVDKMESKLDILKGDMKQLVLALRALSETLQRQHNPNNPNRHSVGFAVFRNLLKRKRS